MSEPDSETAAWLAERARQAQAQYEADQAQMAAAAEAVGAKPPPPDLPATGTWADEFGDRPTAPPRP